MEYRVSEKEALEVIRPLWEKLNIWHDEHSKYFGGYFTSFNYDMRLKHFIAAEKIKTVILYDDDRAVGYSVATISKGTGTIESLYIEPEYRGRQLGEKLMAIPIDWMTDSGAKRITLGVSVGNEGVYPFYKKFGFLPRTTILERKI